MPVLCKLDALSSIIPIRKSLLLTPTTIWVALCALLNAAGWALSAIGQLNLLGYGVVVVLAGLAITWMYRHAKPEFRFGFRISRFRRPFPMAFAFLAILALLGGFLHAPNNYDALAYRTPRVLHWLAQGQWHWIHTDFQRLNTRGCGIEWVTAPLVLFTGTDRFFFLINAVSFLFMPSLSYRVLTGLGVRRKVAWHWMWLFPTGYCYLLQAGSIANDLFGATLALIAVDLALQASRQRSATAALLSILAAALMTAGKGFNLLLLFPWALAMMPTIVCLLRRPFATLLVGLVAALVSLLPTSLLNTYYSGDWKGIKAEPVNLGTGEPLLHLGLNGALVALQNLNPPFNPFAGAWNQWIEKRIPTYLASKLVLQFEEAGAKLRLGEMQMEEAAGLGLGITLLLLPVLFGILQKRHFIFSKWCSCISTPAFLVPAGAWSVMIYFFTQSGLACPARYLAPSYILMLAPILCLPRASKLLRCRWWRYLAMGVFLFAALLLVATPARPLWPSKTFIRQFNEEAHLSPFLKRIWRVYSVYSDRADGFAPVLSSLPPNLKVLGFVTFDDPETSLWRPFGSLRVDHVTRADNTASIRKRGIELVLVSEYIVVDQESSSIRQWQSDHDSEIVKSFDLSLRATRGPTRWHLVRVRPDPSKTSEPNL